MIEFVIGFAVGAVVAASYPLVAARAVEMRDVVKERIKELL